MKQELKGPNAYFEYTFKDIIKNQVNEESWTRLFIDKPKENTIRLVHDHSVIFKLPYTKVDSKINLDFKKIHSASPEQISKSDYKNELTFKIDSKPIDIIQIDGDKITFLNGNSEVNTVHLSSDLTLKMTL